MKDDDDQPNQEQVTVDLPAAEESSSPSTNPVRRITLLVLAVCVLLFIWYLMADRYAPWTDQGRVQAFVVPISPKVPGRVIKVDVQQDQVVKAGELLAEINPRDYELAVKKAQASLEQATQNIGASADSVNSAEAKLEKARAERAFVEKQAERYIELAAKGVVAQADADKAKAEVKKATATVNSAQSDLYRARERLGEEGENNPKIRNAAAALDRARTDLAATRLTAPTDGGITNLLVDEGQFANAGAPLMTFVAFDEVWVQANLRENSLGHIKIGGKVEIALDSAPGEVFSGEVSSIGFAVDQPSGGEAGELVSIKASSGWLQDAQRFPVRVKVTDERVRGRGLIRVGGQADVQFYTEGSAVLNSLGWLWIRLISLFSYVH